MNWEHKIGDGPQRRAEQGFMLLGLIVAVAIILIVLSVAATKVAFSLRREREVESERRAQQYVRAIQLYYRKMGSYPGSIEMLENTNTIRFLRKRYVDPLTGKPDYRLIGVGQNKTTVTGFFGEPLAGIAGAGLGAASGMQSGGIGGAAPTGGAPGIGGVPGAGGAPGAAGAPGTGSPTDSGGMFGSSSGFGDSSGFGGSSGSGGTSGGGGTSSFGSAAGMGSSGIGGSMGPFMGVGSSATGTAILVVNQQTTYQTWEFLYDPRIEMLKAAAALNGGDTGTLGGGAPGQSSSGFGQPSSGSGSSGFGSSFGQPSSGSGSSGFGSSSFGQSSSGTGQSPSTPGGTSPMSSP